MKSKMVAYKDLSLNYPVHIIIAFVVPYPLRGELKGKEVIGLLIMTNSMARMIPSTANERADKTHPQIFLILTLMALDIFRPQRRRVGGEMDLRLSMAHYTFMN